jgi:excisionase family DNA binding protein
MHSPNATPPQLYTITEAAKYLAVSPALLYRLVAAREIDHIRIGTGRGTIRFDEPSLEQYKRSREG